MLTAVAIDAGWLRSLDDWSHEEYFSALDFLAQLKDRRVPILLDTGGHILAEYERVLVPDSIGRRFFELMMKLGLIEYGTGTPKGDCSSCLRSLHFDPSDIPYVAVAAHLNGFYLTHERKHLDGEAFGQVPLGCGVIICDLTRAQELLDEEPID